MNRYARLTSLALGLATAATIGTATTAHAATNAPSATTHACTAGQLTITASKHVVKTDRTHREAEIFLKNTSRSRCSVSGFPAAEILRYDGSVLEHAKDLRSPIPARRVVLSPGYTAVSFLEGTKINKPGNCGETWAAVRVAAPNTHRTTRLDVQWPKCFTFGVLRLQPLQV